MPPRFAELRPAGRHLEHCPRSGGSSPSPHPPDAGSAGSSAAGQPAGTVKSLRTAERVKKRQETLKHE